MKHNTQSPLFILLALFCLSLASCGTLPPITGETLYLNPYGGISSDRDDQEKEQPYRHPSAYWVGDGVSGSPKIVIRLIEQKAYFFKGSKLVGVSPISTGKSGYETPRGSFSISQKDPDHKSNIYGKILDAQGNVVNSDADVRTDPVPPGGKFVGASMPYFMRFNGGVGMHSGYVPNYPASHGCVRMPDHMAQKFYYHVSHGTPVIVE